jgi:hypothetical protein
MNTTQPYTGQQSAKASEFFQSKFLRAADLGTDEWEFTIARWDRQEFESDDGPQEKPVLYFTTDRRGFVVNKTNMRMLAAMFGDDLNGWNGKSIVLQSEPVQFQGRVVNSIRVRKPAGARSAAAT